MTLAIALVILLSLAVMATLASRQHRHWHWHVTQSSLGVMSEQWVAEQRADESRHRST